MIKRSADEPADKAAERLRQFEEAREPVPAEEKEPKEAPKPCPEKEETTPKKAKPTHTKKTN